MKIRTAARNPSTSNPPPGSRNRVRFRLARLQAESSRNMYSEHGFDELIGPAFGQVCQRWIVSSYCIPGSPHAQAAAAISSSRTSGSTASIGRPVVTATSGNSARSAAARPAFRSASSRKRSVARTERFEFWKLTVRAASPSIPRE
jgi:hypothetical protein